MSSSAELLSSGLNGAATAPDGTVIGFQAAGDGPSVLLVHGAASDARQWAAVVPLLALTHRVVTMNRRGRGASGAIRSDHSVGTEYGDIAAVAAALPGPVHLVGHSSGARLALHAALRIDSVASLVLYEPPPPETFAAGVLDSLAEMEANGDREGILRTFLLDVAGNDEEALAFIRGRPIWPIMLDNALTLPAELRAAKRYRFDPVPFGGLAVPTLCLLGECSGPEVAQVAERVVAALPDGRVAILRGQGHGAMFSAPALLVDELRRFFASAPE